MITAPYNFVPLNKEVFYPSWADDVSHDVPFEDGESGEIEITITAKSPIFIRNHSDDKDNPSSEFCHFINENGAKEFYIPGSSIKGMVRSVLEIMSFSKIAIDEEKFKKPLSVRDMTNQKELVGTANGCGFLIKNGNTYQLEDCGNILTISHFDLQKNYPNIKKLETAKAKYEKFGFQTVKYQTYTKMMKVGQREIAKKMAKIDVTQQNSGILVFSGDIGNKKHEFIFKSGGQKIQLESSIISNFKKAYFENDESVDGQYWKEKSKQLNVKIPVFYLKTKDTNKIIAIGLTQLFKLAYTKTIFDASKQDSNPNKLDLTQTIFGTEKDKLALKGRVQFSHLKCTIERYEKQVDAILGSPNPTYYPNYIRQDGTNGKVSKYKTLMDTDAVISGWKRYPLHNQTMQSGESSDKESVKTHFKPLESGTVFKGKLRFHNLKKCEIGALLSAITFHGQSDKCMHNIGMAKPLGYGKIDIKLIPKNLKYSQNEYLQEFEEEISKKISDWKNSAQLKELFAMANITTKSNQQLAYQLLEKKTGRKKKNGDDEVTNEFTDVKKAREYLMPHSVKTITSEKKIISEKFNDIKIQKQKTEFKNTNQTQQKNEFKEYSIEEIAKEVGVKLQNVLDFIQNSTLPISKKLNLNSTLKEAQAKNLIKEMTKSK